MESEIFSIVHENLNVYSSINQKNEYKYCFLSSYIFKKKNMKSVIKFETSKLLLSEMFVIESIMETRLRFFRNKTF